LVKAKVFGGALSCGSLFVGHDSPEALGNHAHDLAD